MAQEMARSDVFFNCKTCPFADCYEPDTREEYLADEYDRQAQIQRMIDKENRMRMEREGYEESPYYKRVSDSADKIKRMLVKNTALTDEEFNFALTFARDHGSFSPMKFEEVVAFQLKAIGFEKSAGTVKNYMYSIQEDW
jgi:hypothetical protein